MLIKRVKRRQASAPWHLTDFVRYTIGKIMPSNAQDVPLSLECAMNVLIPGTELGPVSFVKNSQFKQLSLPILPVTATFS